MGLFGKGKVGDLFNTVKSMLNDNEENEEETVNGDVKEVKNEPSYTVEYSPKLKHMLEIALRDGEVTEKERNVLLRIAEEDGLDKDEFEMELDGMIFDAKQAKNNVSIPTNSATSVPPIPGSAPASASVAYPQGGSSKAGTTKKCPKCGAILGGIITVCPECGYEFIDIAANSSSERLARRFEQILNDCNSKSYPRQKGGGLMASYMRAFDMMDTEENRRETDVCTQQATVLRTFPIPVSKADLFEFISMLGPEGTKGKLSSFQAQGQSMGLFRARQELRNAYITKYKECVAKAKALFPNDEQLNALLKIKY